MIRLLIISYFVTDTPVYSSPIIFWVWIGTLIKFFFNEAYTLFQNGGDPGWSGSSCTKTRHRGPRNTRDSKKQPQGNGQTYCEFRKKSTKTANITRCLQDFEKPRLFWLMNTFTRSRLTKIKVIFIIARSASTVSKSASDHIINLKLALCIVSGEVEYAYCGPSCTAGKSGFCNHILALMCPLL